MTTAYEPKPLAADVDLMALRPTVFGAKMIHDGGLGGLPNSDMAKALWEAAQSNLLVDFQLASRVRDFLNAARTCFEVKLDFLR